MKAIILYSAFCILLAGCGSEISEVMESYIGHHNSTLITNWGPPTHTMDDGDGGKLFIYEYGRSFSTQGHATTTPYGLRSNPYYETVYTPPQTTSYAASRTFWINGDGYIYRWAWKGI